MYVPFTNPWHVLLLPNGFFLLLKSNYKSQIFDCWLIISAVFALLGLLSVTATSAAWVDTRQTDTDTLASEAHCAAQWQRQPTQMLWLGQPTFSFWPSALRAYKNYVSLFCGLIKSISEHTCQQLAGSIRLIGLSLWGQCAPCCHDFIRQQGDGEVESSVYQRLQK